jgi:hypothetical protein
MSNLAVYSVPRATDMESMTVTATKREQIQTHSLPYSPASDELWGQEAKKKGRKEKEAMSSNSEIKDTLR